VGGEEGARKVKMYASSHPYFSDSSFRRKNAPSSFLHTENNNQIQLAKGSSPSEHCHEFQVPQKLGNFLTISARTGLKNAVFWVMMPLGLVHASDTLRKTAVYTM